MVKSERQCHGLAKIPSPPSITILKVSSFTVHQRNKCMRVVNNNRTIYLNCQVISRRIIKSNKMVGKGFRIIRKSQVHAATGHSQFMVMGDLYNMYSCMQLTCYSIMYACVFNGPKLKQVKKQSCEFILLTCSYIRFFSCVIIVDTRMSSYMIGLNGCLILL